MKFEQGTFNWAITQIKQGKKVRMKRWADGYRLSLKNGTIYDDNRKKDAYLLIEWIEADDWEFYEEPKKTLSDKLMKKSLTWKYGEEQIGFLNGNDVKEAIIEFLNKADISKNEDVLVKEIFGEELLR